MKKRDQLFGSGALGMVLTGALLLSCARQSVDLGDAPRLPSPAQIVLPVPRAVSGAADTITELTMQNVSSHVDDQATLGVHRLQGRMRALDGSHVVSFDDPPKDELDIATGEVG